MRRPRPAWALATAMLVLASCGGDDPSDTAPTSLAVTSTSAVGTTATTTTTTTSTTTTTTTTRPSALELRHDGIGSMRIGRDRASDIINVFSSRFGEPTFDRAIACESGSDRIVHWTDVDLTLVFNEGVWAGYLYAAKRQPPLPAADGLAIGTTVGALKSKYPSGLHVINGSLGPEFSAPDGWRGFTNGTADSATIVRLGAGDICAFR